MTVHGIVNSYNTMGMSFTTVDGQAVYVDTGPGALQAGKTYYWRVDEFNPPTTVKGDIWSFSTLPDIPVTDPNLVAWYKFEAGSGKKVIDFSGHGNHGDIIDNVLWVPGQFNLGLEFLGDDEGVITSYSIHYTKLYEDTG